MQYYQAQLFCLFELMLYGVPQSAFLAQLFLKTHGLAKSLPKCPGSICHSSVNIFKALDKLNSNFKWRLVGMGELKFVQIVLFT